MAAGVAEIGNVKNAGVFVTQEDGAALTALQVIDNIVHVDDAAYTLGADSGVMMMGFAGTQSVNANDAGAISMETDGSIHIHDGGNAITVDWAGTAPPIGAGVEATALRVTVATDSTGVLSVDDNGGSLTVDGTITANAGTGTMTVDGSGVTQPVSGTVTANLGATDNAVLDQIEVNTSYGDSVGAGTEAAALRVTLANDSTGLLSVDDNGGSLTIDNAQLSVTGGGTEAAAMRVTIANDSTGVLSIDDNGGSLTVDGTVTASSTTGNAAHDAAAAGNPVLIGSRATAGVEALTEVAEADASYISTDLQGVVITRPYIAAQEHVQYHVVNTAGTELVVTGLDAGGAGIHNYVTSVIVHNAHASTNGFIQLLDGTGGTPMATFPAPATGGAVINFTQPIKQPTANTALYWDASAAITTLYVTIIGYQGQG